MIMPLGADSNFMYVSNCTSCTGNISAQDFNSTTMFSSTNKTHRNSTFKS